MYMYVHVHLILNGCHIFGTGNALIAGAIYMYTCVYRPHNDRDMNLLNLGEEL